MEPWEALRARSGLRMACILGCKAPSPQLPGPSPLSYLSVTCNFSFWVSKHLSCMGCLSPGPFSSGCVVGFLFDAVAEEGLGMRGEETVGTLWKRN